MLSAFLCLPAACVVIVRGPPRQSRLTSSQDPYSAHICRDFGDRKVVFTGPWVSWGGGALCRGHRARDHLLVNTFRGAQLRPHFLGSTGCMIQALVIAAPSPGRGMGLECGWAQRGDHTFPSPPAPVASPAPVSPLTASVKPALIFVCVVDITASPACRLHVLGGVSDSSLLPTKFCYTI